MTNGNSVPTSPRTASLPAEAIGVLRLQLIVLPHDAREFSLQCQRLQWKRELFHHANVKILNGIRFCYSRRNALNETSNLSHRSEER